MGPGRLALLSSLSVLLMILPVQADPPSDRKRIPDLELRVGSRQQRVSPSSATWSWCEAEGGGGGGVAIDGIPVPPKHGIEVDLGVFRGTIRIDKDERPNAIHLAGKTQLDPVFGPSGPGEKVRWRLRARRVGDRVIGWVIFLRSRVEDHLYLTVRARWANSCQLGRGEAVYELHVEAA